MSASRVNHQPAFLLSSKPYRENSLRLEMFSRDYGRVSLLARSARTRGSELRGVLVPFVPVSVSWYGKEETKTLHRAEWLGGWPLPASRNLFAALYVNELLLKLTAREDALPAVYDSLLAVMQGMASGGRTSVLLRHFEWQLLCALGLAPDWRQDADGVPPDDAAYYRVCAEMPLLRCAAGTPCPAGAVDISGATVRQLGEGGALDAAQAVEAADMMRLLLAHYLPEGIAGRRTLLQLQDWKTKLRQRDGGTTQN